MLNINSFISNHITHRQESLFAADILANREVLTREIKDKSVLVIGGAGTIGSSYIKALLRYNPAKLIVVDISENGLTELTRDLRSTHLLKVPGVYLTYPLNFADPLFDKILQLHGPFDIVANFAAHKHVRSEKDPFSVAALLENNVLKAERLLQYLNSFPPKHFFCVSTDKAANPVNIMGASKKIMEEVIMSYSQKFPITTARFANVAFSQGSLPDGFLYRMMKQQPLSAPSDVKRYFVSPQESGEICLLACILGQTGDIFFPKLDESQMITFSDIAIAFLEEQGFQPVICETEDEAKRFYKDNPQSLIPNPQFHWPVYFFTSDTSGEKAYEEFYTEGEELDLDTFSALGVIKNAPSKSFEEIGNMIKSLESILQKPGATKAEIVKVLSQLIPSFEHIETGKNLDQKM